MLSLNNKKFFFLFKLKFNFLNYDYLCFIKYYNHNLKNLCIRYGLELLKIQSKNCKKIFTKNAGQRTKVQIKVQKAKKVI